MLNKKRLLQVETSLSPRRAAVLWLRREVQGKTAEGYARWLAARPVTAAPRIRIERQVVNAIIAAMKGDDPVRIQQAARQAKMETDFLISLVLRTNSVIRRGMTDNWLDIQLLLAQLSSLRTGEEEQEWVNAFGKAVTEIFGIQLTVQRIEAKYFDGECILFADLIEAVGLLTVILRHFLAGLGKEMTEGDHPELAIGSAEFGMVVADKSSKNIAYVTALAKSTMFEHFGLGEAANAVMKPHILGDCESPRIALSNSHVRPHH